MTMTHSVCLLCLEVSPPNFKDDDSSAKIKIVTLYELFHPFLSSPRKKANKYKEDSETCSLCRNCSVATREAEEIRDQIVKLEARLREKVDTIKLTVLNSNCKGENGDGLERVRAIRNYLMDENPPNISPEVGDIRVKEEHVHEAESEDLCFDNYLPPSSGDEDHRPHKEEIYSDPDYSFCILPDLAVPVKVPDPKYKRRLRPPVRPSSKSKKPKPEVTSVNEESQPPLRRTTRPVKPIITKSLLKLLASDSEEEARPPKKKSSKRQIYDDSNDSSDSEDDSDDDPDPEDSDYSEGSDYESDEPYQPAMIKSSSPTKKPIGPPSSWEYECSMCSRPWPSEDDLLAHLAQPMFSCPLCPSTFCMSGLRDAHVKETHGTTRPFHCSHCKRKTLFRRQNGLAAHIFMKHETNDKPHTCPRCDKRFTLEENLKRHVDLHKFEKTRPFLCDVCDYRFTTREVLDKHWKSHVHVETVQRCDQCDFKCRTRSALTRHKRFHTGERKYKCTYCEETFIDYNTRLKHIHTLHETTPLHQCHICPKRFFSAGKLNAHLKGHEDKSPVPCASCDKVFPTVLKMQSHRVEVHGDEAFICEECGGSYATMKALKSHKAVHTRTIPTERLFKCDVCDSAFRTNSTLASHKKIHTGEGRRHTCPTCGKEYRSKGHLDRHVIHIHNMDYQGETKHKCAPCGRGFPSKDLLDWHVRQLHTGDGPKYPCTHGCDVAYSDSTMLTHHIRGHHGIMVGGQRKHSKTWKVTKKKKGGTDGGSSSSYSAGGNSVGRPINNLTAVVEVETEVDRAVWGLGQNVWLG